MAGKPGTGSAGINRHIVGDERALQERDSDSILTSSLAPEEKDKGVRGKKGVGKKGVIGKKGEGERCQEHVK